MACKVEQVIDQLKNLEGKNVDISELKAQVDKKIAEKQAMMNFSEAFKKERPSAIKWLAKEEAKYKVATQAISDGVYDSTAGFIKRFYGDKANSGNYTKDDVIYLSTNGNRKGRLAPVVDGKLQGAYTNIDKAIEVGASFVADTSSHLKSTSKYNVGEVELANYLSSKGYVREDKSGYGLWTKQYSKPLSSSIIKDDYGYTIINPTGKEVGTAFIEEYYKDGTIGITIDLNSNERNKGYGIASYLQIAISENKTLKSVNPNENAYRLWNSLVKKGVASRVQVGVWEGENNYSFAKDGMPQYEFLLTPTNAKNYLQTLQNTNWKKDIIADSSIKWDDKNNTIVNSDGKTKIKVNTLDELTKLSEEYHDLLTSKLGSSDVDFEKHKEYFLGLFKQLETAGIKFKPVTIHFTKTVKDGDLGKAYKTKDEIELSTSKVFENRYPLKIALHEYAHILTMNELDKYPQLAKRTEEIMNNVLKQFPELAGEYGFKDKYEFIAEAMSSPRFQTQLAAAKSDGKSSIVDKVKKIFNYLLSKANTSEVNALTDALEVVVGLTNPDLTKDSNNVSLVVEEVSDGVFINSNVPIMEYRLSTSNVDKINKPLVNTIKTTVAHLGGSKDNLKEAKDKLDYIYSNIKDNELKKDFDTVIKMDNEYIEITELINNTKNEVMGIPSVNSIDYWKTLAMNLANAHLKFDNAVQKLYSNLEVNYGVVVTKNQKYSESLKTGKTSDLYKYLYVNKALIKTQDNTKDLYTKEQELAKTIDTVNKNKPFYKHYIKDSVMGNVYPHTMLNGEIIYVPAGNTGFYYDSNKKRITVQSTGSSIQAKLNDIVNHIRGSDDYEGEFGTGSDVQTQAIPSIDLGSSLKAIFWNLENDDRSDVTSEGEESASVPIRSQEFAAFTEHMLDTYVKNMSDLGSGTVAIDFYKNEDLNTSGMLDLDTKKMSLRYNRMSRTARISEIFLHEVNHLVSADVFANNPRLRRLMEDLRQAALDSGVDYKVFLEGVDNPTSEEIEIAKRKFDYVFDTAADPEEFYAYATTNENVYNAIKDITVKSELVKSLGKVESTMQKILQKLIDVINQVWSVTTGRSQKGSTQILSMISMIDNLAREKAEEVKKESEPSVTNRVKNVFNKIDEKVNPIMDKIEAKSKKLKRGLPSTRMLNKIMDLKMMRDVAGSGAVQYLIREVTRDTTAPEFSEYYMIARKTKQVVERATNQIKVGVEEAVKQMFEGETNSTKKAITHVMFDLDLGHLLDTMDKEGVVDMIMDPSKRVAEITKVEAELGTTKYAGQIDGLAEYIVSGNTVMMNQQINANNIVEYMNQYPKINSKTYRETRKHIALVDKLVSLKALDKVSSENTQLVQEYLGKDGKSDVLMDSLTMYKNYMDQMKKDAQTSQYNPIKKGYTQAPASPIKYALIPEDQVKAQLSVNMHLESTDVYTVIAGKNYYLMTGKIKSVGFNEGAFGMISNTLDGVSMSSLMRDRFEEVGFGADQIDEKIEKLVESISKGQARGRQFNLGNINAMIPVHNKAGKIVDYRIQLNKIDRIEMLKEEEDVAKVLAHTYARADKLVRTAEQNRNVVDTVIRQSAVGMSENPEDYVVLEEYTKEDREAGLPYTKLNERWDRIPDYTKDYIREKLGVSKLPIHKDFVELITGEKQMTLGNFNYLGLDMKQHPVARARIMALESWVRELLAYVKQTTVVLNGSVVMGNTISNMITAAVHGIDPITYIGEVRKKWLLLNEYNELERKLARLNVDRMAGKDVNRKIRQLEDQKVRHPYHSLVEDGQFSPIVEDVNVDMETNGQLATILKNMIDKTKLGHAIHPVLEFAYLDKKTKIYKTMLKVTQYGDAITRQIILEKNVAKRESKLGRKLNSEEYQEELNYVDQLLINYGYVANRVWDWMEKVAGLNFMKYYLRNVKATYKMFNRNKSATAFEMGSQYLTGVDFSDSMDTYAKSPIMALTNRFMLDDVPSELSTPHIFGLLPDFSSIVKFH